MYCEVADVCYYAALLIQAQRYGPSTRAASKHDMWLCGRGITIYTVQNADNKTRTFALTPAAVTSSSELA